MGVAETRDIQRLVDRGCGRQPIGRGGRRQKAWGGRRFADATRTSVGRAVIGEIEMDVIVVEDVCARPEDGGEILTGAGMDLVQKGGFLSVSHLPVAYEFDQPPVSQRKTCNVDRVSESVFGKASAGNIVDRAATIGAKHVDGGD